MNPDWSAPPLHGARARRADARISGAMTVIGSAVALAFAPTTPAPSLAYAFAGLCIALGVLMLRLAERTAPWFLTVSNVMGAAGITSVAVHAPDGFTYASGPILFVIAMLQVGLLRSRREAWLQLVWAVTTYGVGLHLVHLPTEALVEGLLPVAVSLTVVTIAVTWLRARVDVLGQELNRLLDELRRQAEHDALTGLLNRQGLVRRASAPGVLQAGTVVLLDVDHFKRTNDEQGHQRGDDLLASLGPVLAALPVAPEMAVRVGGEEFLMILAGTDPQAARDRAERVRTQASQVLSRSGAGPVTVSVGVAVGAFGPTFEDVYRRADQALYRAKRTGRDRVVLDGGAPSKDVRQALPGVLPRQSAAPHPGATVTLR